MSWSYVLTPVLATSPSYPLKATMEKLFYTAGPTISADNCHIAPLQRGDWQEIGRLIAAKRYFVLHAPRQTG